MVHRSWRGWRYFPAGCPARPQRSPYPPLKRATKQTGLDKHRYETYPFRLGRNPITSGVHLQRPLYLYLCQPRFLRTIGTGTQPHQYRKRKPATDLLLPLRPNQHTERDDRHPRQSVVVRRLHRLGSSERGNRGNGYRLPFRLQNQYYKGTSWSPSSNINAFIATDLLTKRR